MNAADTSASSAIAPWTPLTVVSRSSTTFEIDTFISDVSTTRTNIAIASRRASLWLPPAPSGSPVTSSVRLRRQPRLRVRQVGDPEALRLAGQQEGERAQRGAHPVLVAHHRQALERRRVPRAEARVRLQRVAF